MTAGRRAEKPAVTLYVGSEVRRGPDYVRVVIVPAVDSADAVEALDLTSRTGPYLLETATAPGPGARGCWEGLDHDPPPKIFVRRPSAGITLLVGLSSPMEAPASAPAATIGPESGASILPDAAVSVPAAISPSDERKQNWYPFAVSPGLGECYRPRYLNIQRLNYLWTIRHSSARIAGNLVT